MKFLAVLLVSLVAGSYGQYTKYAADMSNDEEKFAGTVTNINIPILTTNLMVYKAEPTNECVSVDNPSPNLINGVAAVQLSGKTVTTNSLIHNAIGCVGNVQEGIERTDVKLASREVALEASQDRTFFFPPPFSYLFQRPPYFGGCNSLVSRRSGSRFNCAFSRKSCGQLTTTTTTTTATTPTTTTTTTSATTPTTTTTTTSATTPTTTTSATTPTTTTTASSTTTATTATTTLTTPV